ncbi:MAG: SBBP repeat-containing protein [Bacteroidales bacterium]|nr:SBBP repeat-containing protein [Bacteroidales bacterium]
MKQIHYIIVCFIFFLLSSSKLWSQVVFSDWIISSGQKGWDIVNDFAIDTSGNILIVGSTTDPIGVRGFEKLVSPLRKNSFMAAFDTNGQQLWSKRFTPMLPGYIKKIVPTSDNEFLIVAAEKGSDDKIGQVNFFLACLYANGNQKWKIPINGKIYDGFTSLRCEPLTHEILLSGFFFDTLTIGNQKFISKGGSDGFIVRFSEKGELEDYMLFQGKGNDKIVSAITDSIGNMIITGSFIDNLESGNITLKSPVSKEITIFLAIFNREKQCIQSRVIGSGKNIEVYSLSADKLGYYLTGSFCDFFRSEKILFESRGEEDIFVLSLDLKCNILWEKHFGGIRKDRPCTIHATDTEILLSGSFSSRIYLEQFSLESVKESSDVLVLSMDKDGRLNWVRQLGGENNDYPSSMVISQTGDIYISGSYSDILTIGNNSVSSSGEEDIFLARLENCRRKAPKIKSPELFCPGDSIILQAGEGFSTYNWNNGEGNAKTFSIDHPGLCTLVRTATNGCIVYDSIELIEHPLPFVNIGNDTAIADTSILVMDAGKDFLFYRWSNGDSLAHTVITGYDLVEGYNTIWVKVTDHSGCQGYDEKVVLMASTTPNAISRYLNAKTIVFPNPVNDLLTIQITMPIRRLELTITNSLGIKIVNKKFTDYSESTPVVIPLKNYTPGLYTIAIMADGASTVKKIILK